MNDLGKYDQECTALRESTNGKLCMVLVVDGNKGNGFSLQTEDSALLIALAGVLEQVAGEIRRQASHS